jgi:hypothetical protein
LKLTEPVGVPALLLTVAVKVTAWPTLLGFTEDASVVVVAARLTTCVNAGEVLAEKLASPP